MWTERLDDWYSVLDGMAENNKNSSFRTSSVNCGTRDLGAKVTSTFAVPPFGSSVMAFSGTRPSTLLS